MHDFNPIVTMQEFMMATDMTASGSPEEKLRWAFKMYDKDGSGDHNLTILHFLTPIHASFFVTTQPCLLNRRPAAV